MAIRDERLRAELQKLTAEFLAARAGHPPVGGLVTVTDLKLSPRGDRATALITVWPETRERTALAFAKRMRPELRQFMKSRGRLSRLPFFDFAIDEEGKRRARVDQLLGENSA